MQNWTQAFIITFTTSIILGVVCGWRKYSLSLRPRIGAAQILLNSTSGNFERCFKFNVWIVSSRKTEVQAIHQNIFSPSDKEYDDRFKMTSSRFNGSVQKSGDNFLSFWLWMLRTESWNLFAETESHNRKAQVSSDLSDLNISDFTWFIWTEILPRSRCLLRSSSFNNKRCALA